MLTGQAPTAQMLTAQALTARLLNHATREPREC
jgi:hypothetical protein